MAPANETGQPVGPLDFAKLKPLNPRIDNRVVRATGEKCYVQVPFDKPPKSWQPHKTKQVDCPPEMDDPAWDHCHGGDLHKHVDTGQCVCVRDGNPPPPSVAAPCPKT